MSNYSTPSNNDDEIDYGWFRDLDTEANVVVLECIHNRKQEVYKIRPVYVPYEPAYSQNISIINLDDDIESQQYSQNPGQIPINTNANTNSALKSHIECTTRVLYVMTICVFYICICW